MLDFMASQDGLQLMDSFMRIRSARVRRSIVDHVKALAADEESRSL
jgi:hypothetical protein